VDRLGAFDEVVGRIDVGRHVGEHAEGGPLPAAVLVAVGRGQSVLEAKPPLAVYNGKGEVYKIGHTFLLARWPELIGSSCDDGGLSAER
jgi:hypothetical protein